ncbi:MAG: hypothetical protein IIC87_02335 [Chloroflexi bacterium]|nr:hypothetical protein [Chloroflexota bacterium]
MSVLVGLLAIILLSVVLMVLRFRSRIWGSVVLSIVVTLAVIGWLAAFSLAGLALFVAGVTIFGIGVEGTVLARKRT